MSEPRDAVPIEIRYAKQADAAVKAARAALGTAYSSAESVAKIEAIGRVAAALIAADREAS